jgi:hypothetical protein
MKKIIALIVLFCCWQPLVVLAAVKAKNKGQISAGGIKISAEAPYQLKFNQLPPAAAVEPAVDPNQLLAEPGSRFFPVVDLTKIIPQSFLSRRNQAVL